MRKDRLDEIGRTSRHALATRATELDSWLNAYREDVPELLADIHELRSARRACRRETGVPSSILTPLVWLLPLRRKETQMRKSAKVLLFPFYFLWLLYGYAKSLKQSGNM